MTFTVRLETSGVVTAVPAEMPQVVEVGKVAGQISTTGPLKVSSGTTCKRKVAATPGFTVICWRAPLASVI